MEKGILGAFGKMLKQVIRFLKIFFNSLNVFIFEISEYHLWDTSLLINWKINFLKFH